MPASLRVSTGSSPPHNFLDSLRNSLRNLFQLLGFEPASNTAHRLHRKHMLRPHHSWGIFPVLPRDYIRRRRVVRRISNIVIVILLSLAVAYAIVHVSGPAPFAAPHH
jgi:hypothetical protein